MTTAHQILNAKGNEVYSIEPDATVFEAIKLMADKGIGAILVMDAGKVVGIISERDYARKVILKGKASKETLIKDIMTTRVIYAHPHQSLEECMALMTEKHVRHLPVMDGEQLVGIVSIGDLVKTIIAEQRYTIEQLEQYITG
jgi:CBS domain-containing protein